MKKRTPIFPAYEQESRLICFGGWMMPVRFSSIKAEHEAVRTRAGLFDVSHMGEIEVSGSDALLFLQQLTSNDLSQCRVGQAQYSLLCTEKGTTIDDLLIYRVEKQRFLLVVNAANIEKDFAWLQTHQSGDVKLVNKSEEIAMLALQGPYAASILQPHLKLDVNDIKPFHFVCDVPLFNIKVILSRTGYTGEDGFELYCPADQGIHLWKKLLQIGREQGLVPCGLGARDTLRLEAGLPLYGNELSNTITPIEAGLSFAVKTEKNAFIGKDALVKQKQAGPARRLVGIEMIGRGIPRTGYPVYCNEQEIGFVTSGTQSPTTQKRIGFALIDQEYAQIKQRIEIEIRRNRIEAIVVPRPFYKRNQKNGEVVK
ncbi:aminomethyltransferase [Seinonella peptonophila]|uniref:Aminomethyltransferase n=1 Tax=Seinonella peptonophila TaxID=112248 RepID=A0A1M4TPB3_9BACL|nr:glycine cleavage system aminomethyltransferase GcvT [Seinonella peptonophila]SHE46359.1 aminomethyltransferase [Seinonella peptonophila]